MNIYTQFYLISHALSPYLFRGSIFERDLIKISGLVDALVKILPMPVYNLTPSQLIRATLNKSIPDVGNQRITEIRHLKYPPSNVISKYGRCNMPKMSILYGAFHFITAIKELRPALNDLVTKSEWNLKENRSLRCFPIFFLTNSDKNTHNEISLMIKVAHENFISKMNPDERQYTNAAMEFLAKCFAKEVDTANHLDYFLSAYISKKIFEDQRFDFEAILYPSVKESLGLSNMAIKPSSFDEKFILKEVRTETFSHISKGPPKGLIFDTLNWTKDFDHENGIIIWKD